MLNRTFVKYIRRVQFISQWCHLIFILHDLNRIKCCDLRFVSCVVRFGCHLVLSNEAAACRFVCDDVNNTFVVIERSQWRIAVGTTILRMVRDY